MTLQQKFYRMHKDNEIGYERWWHSFTGHDPQTGEEKSFFIEFYLCNPALGSEKPILGQHPAARREKLKPSYLMVKVGTWGADAVQVHKFYGWKRIHVDRDIPFSIQAGDCYLTEDATRGIVRVSDEEASRHPEWMCKGGAMSWSLLVDKKTATQAGSRREGTRAEFRGEVLWKSLKLLCVIIYTNNHIRRKPTGPRKICSCPNCNASTINIYVYIALPVEFPFL